MTSPFVAPLPPKSVGPRKSKKDKRKRDKQNSGSNEENNEAVAKRTRSQSRTSVSSMDTTDEEL